MADSPLRTLLERIKDRRVTVGIVGLGYVGLPLTRAFAENGIRVLGFDVDADKVSTLNAGGSYLKSVTAEEIRRWQDAGTFDATADMERLSEPDALLICVPTPLTASKRSPDLTYVSETAWSIAKQLRPGQLVVLESTTYPTTTRDVVLPILQTSKLCIGEDFLLAYSPEREDPGSQTHSTKTIPKVVGGYDRDSLLAATALYEQAVQTVVPVDSLEIAEACKILENTYRAVNIALVNELKLLFAALNIDVWDVIEAAKTKPFGFQAFYPGPGLGGHCIPIDPFYLAWLARQKGLRAEFIELAGHVNAQMPGVIVDAVSRELELDDKPQDSVRVLVIGVAYKPNVDDPRESPAFEIMDSLRLRGAVVSYHDPHIPELPKMRHRDVLPLRSVPLTAKVLQAQDAVVIVTDHDGCDWGYVVRNSKLVFDSRNATKHVRRDREKIRKV